MFVRDRKGKTASEGVGGKDERMKSCRANSDLSSYVAQPRTMITQFVWLYDYRHQDDQTIASRRSTPMNTANLCQTERTRGSNPSAWRQQPHLKWYMRASDSVRRQRKSRIRRVVNIFTSVEEFVILLSF